MLNVVKDWREWRDPATGILQFNTNALYRDHGQIFVAARDGDSVVFHDVSRGIWGRMPGCRLDARAIHHRYIYNDYDNDVSFIRDICRLKLDRFDETKTPINE